MLVDYLISDKAKQNQYHCANCGNKWSERVDDGENNISCVECGSINTLTRKAIHDPKTDKKLSGFLYVGLGGLLALLGLGMVILTFFNWGFMTCQSLSSGLLGLSGGIPMVMKYFSGKKLLRNKCLDCGHEWEVSREKGISLSQ